MTTHGRTIVGRTIFAAALALVAAAAPAPEDRDAFEAVRRLGRGINFGNALDAPSEGAWGMELKAEYFAAAFRAQPPFGSLEDEARVDERRKSVGLPPLAEYRKQLEEVYRKKP